MAFSVLLTAQGAIAQNLPQAPVANKVSQVSENHGDTRQDNYAWLRDDSRQNESVLNYLRQENTYTEQVSAQWKELKTAFVKAGTLLTITASVIILKKAEKI